VKKGPHAVNALRVLVKGNLATFFVHDKKLTKTKGVLPKGGQLVGVGMEQFSQDPVTEAFDDFKVVQP